MTTTTAPNRSAGAVSLRQPSAVAQGPTVTVQRLLRWTGAANILAGLCLRHSTGGAARREQTL